MYAHVVCMYVGGYGAGMDEELDWNTMCLVPHPTDASLQCEKPIGHEGLHAITLQWGWK